MAENEDAPGGYTEQQWKYIYIGGGTLYTVVVVGLMVIAPAIPGLESPLDVKCSNAFDGGGGATVGIGIFLGLLGSIMINTGASSAVAPLRSGAFAFAPRIYRIYSPVNCWVRRSSRKLALAWLAFFTRVLTLCSPRSSSNSRNSWKTRTNQPSPPPPPLPQKATTFRQRASATWNMSWDRKPLKKQGRT